MKAIRGATTIASNTQHALEDGVRSLLDAILERNALVLGDVVSAIFTLTADLTADYPAKIARQAGWGGVAMLDMQAVGVPGAVPRCVGVLLHVARPGPVLHVYLREACALRPDTGDPFPMTIQTAYDEIGRTRRAADMQASRGLGEIAAVRWGYLMRRGGELAACVDLLRTLYDDEQPHVLARLTPMLGTLLDADSTCSYGVEASPTTISVCFSFAAGELLRPHSFGDAFERVRASRGERWPFFDASCPAPEQRNAAVTLRDLQDLDAEHRSSLRDFLTLVGVVENGELPDQLRVLVCDGPSLLASVGGFRRGTFSARARERLQALTPHLRRRLRLERQLDDARLYRAGAVASMDGLPAPAFLLRQDAFVVHANASARELLDADVDPQVGVRARLARALRVDDDAEFELTRISAFGLTPHYLALRRAQAPQAPERLTLAAGRWALTPRQTEVLALLARGMANKTIAAPLRCAEGTIELHVTALLRRAECESRAELIARFWTLVEQR